MKVGDLVAYAEDGIVDIEPATMISSAGLRGIIIDGPWDTFMRRLRTRRYEVIWYTCGSKGWWEEKHLEILSESR